jgi:hypothetical protein
MEYKVLVVECSDVTGTHFQKAADKLAERVNEAIREGWRPQGGLCTGDSQVTYEPCLMRATVRGIG